MFKINRIDHLVLTVADMEATCSFYEKALGMRVVTFGENRKALAFGNQKINLHKKGREVKPNAQNANCGTADLCFISEMPLEEVSAHLKQCGIEPETDMVNRTGATGPIH